MKAVILADAGPKVGLGHLGRCMAIAQALHKEGSVKAGFVLRDTSFSRWVKRRGFSVVPESSSRFDLAIIDSYRVSDTQWKEWRKRCDVLVTIDDLGRLRKGCDWLINSSVLAKRQYKAKLPARRCLLGPKFHPLRQEFWGSPKRRAPRQQVHHILIILGGGDAFARIRTQILNVVRRAAPGVQLHVVVGPSEKVKGSYPTQVKFHSSPSNMRPLMELCDIAISGAGQTLYELAYVGVPTIAVQLVDNQQANVDGLTAAKAIRLAGALSDKQWPKRLEKQLCHIIQNRSERLRLARAGQRLIDGQGALRIARGLLGRKRHGR